MSTEAKKRMSLPVRIMTGMVLGVIVGYLVGPKIEVIGFVGTIFLRLLRMCIYPLVLISIITGVASVVDISRLKKVGAGFLLYTAITSSIAATLSIIAMKISGAGKGVVIKGVEEVDKVAKVNVLGSFLDWIPDNPFSAMSNGNLIQIIVFALLFGIMLASIRTTESGQLVAKAMDGLNEIVNRMVGWVIGLAPYGVFALMAVIVGTTGVEVMGGVAKMLLTMYASLAAFILIVLPVILYFVAGVNPLRHFRNVYAVMVMAATTGSSAATIPVTMKSAKERCGVPKDIVDLLTAPAATMNMNGAAMEYPICVLFTAQVFGIEYGLTQLAFLVALGVIMSCGAAGVPGGGIMMCAICCSIMGLPETIVPIFAGVYSIIDIGTTMLNVTSDTVGMVTISSRLKELDRDVFYGRKTVPDTSGRFA